MRNSDAQALKGARGGEAGYCGMKIILASVAGVIVGVALPLILVFVVFKKDDDEVVIPRPASDVQCLAICTAHIAAAADGTAEEKCEAAIAYSNTPEALIIDGVDYTHCASCACSDANACESCAAAGLASHSQCEASLQALIDADQTCAAGLASFALMTEAEDSGRDVRHCTRLCECGGDDGETPSCATWGLATPTECTTQLTADILDDGEGNAQTCTEAKTAIDSSPVPLDWTEGKDYQTCNDWCTCNGDALGTCAYPVATAVQCKAAVAADFLADGDTTCAAHVAALTGVRADNIDYTGCADLCADDCTAGNLAKCGTPATMTQCQDKIDELEATNDFDSCAAVILTIDVDETHWAADAETSFNGCKDRCDCNDQSDAAECDYVAATAEQCQTRCRAEQAEEGTCGTADDDVVALADNNADRLNYAACTCNCDGDDCVCE